ncbi:3'-5' exonuclease [Hyphomicrobiales bacterium BP6-180914]|uniref:3'-5' exonuclease n=1 Tax=Lichenifustis flavocetrariae TaxID=2949735 RepID=A0AA41Z8S5_9HYPH|nr:3'-5' exonuclease [Lichenifustis flavocetrariae]MCW6512415.1 3'-5' exonuclease [Lichenifustis flavocetrariae]
MADTPPQLDLFGDLPAHLHSRLGAGLGSLRRSSGSSRRRSSVPIIEPESAARLLSEHDDFRVLRRLRPRTISTPRALEPVEKLTVIVDTETTGLDHAHDEIIEIGMVAFVHDRQGSVIEVTGVFSALQEPSRPISPEITRLTCITDAMVEGRAIDIDAVEQFIEAADLVVAHNAGFDRPFCERLARGFAPKPWACSVKEVGWSAFGFEGSKLGYLVGQCGWFHHGHRAVDDCHALLEVLAAALPSDQGSALSHLLTRTEATRVRIWAEGAPYDLKDQLKRRGYKWDGGSDGRPRSWWVEVEEGAYEAEIAFLEQEIYMRRVRPRAQRITACERYKAV